MIGFAGCARQITKRSAEVHCAIVDPQALSRNELCFLVEQHRH
ncbi:MULTISPECIES: hypothetical protein [unclassified Bradyrhizobium]|nr:MULTISPECIES: hypothetical protein [unclassified Bradyrhizobium]